MNQLPRWASALNISGDQYITWSASAAPGQPALAYALEQGYVDATEYIAWAREEYGLASLEADFFFNGVDVEMVRGARDAESYSAWLYPVGRWDDVTYIACVEPIDGLPESFCQVLADARAMRDAWTAAGEPVVDAYAPAVTEDAPLDMPAGLTLAPKPFSLNLDNFSLDTDHAAPPEAPDLAPAEPEMPSTPHVPHEDTMLGKSVMFDTEHSVIVPHQMPPPAPPAAAPVLSVVPDPVATAPVREESAPIAGPRANEAEAMSVIFTQLNRVFKNACVLRCTEQMVRLYKASPGVKIVGQGPSIDLSYPSFLRIVARTKQPYHGHLIDSPTHQDFFRAIGLTSLPECASAVPLVIDDMLWGMLVVTGTAEQREGAALETVTTAALNLTAALGDTWRQSAA